MVKPHFSSAFSAVDFPELIPEAIPTFCHIILWFCKESRREEYLISNCVGFYSSLKGVHNEF